MTSVAADTFSLELEQSRRSFLKTSNPALFTALDTIGRGMIEYLLTHPERESLKVKEILGLAYFKGALLMPGERNFERVIRTNITAFIVNNYKSTDPELATNYYAHLIREATTQFLPADVLTLGLQRVAIKG